MKKLAVAFFSLFFVIGGVFAQTEASEMPEDTANKPDLSTKIIVPENQHITDKTAKVRIEYTPLSDEARIYYTSMYVTYQKGEAMNTVLACLQDFTKENKYYHYKYLERDRERYFKDERGISWAEYSSHLKFDR
jgi:hypothetical protein